MLEWGATEGFEALMIENDIHDWKSAGEFRARHVANAVARAVAAVMKNAGP